MILKLYVVAIFIFTTSISFGQKHERWNVKTLNDGYNPTLSSAITKSVKEIQKLKRLRVKNTQARLNFEKQVFKITGKVLRKTLETDGDYHIELQDQSIDSTLVCEAVDPLDKSARQSSSLSKFRRVRTIADTLSVGSEITIIGVLFQDKYHSPSAMRTRNFRELHPILKIQ